MACDLAAGRAYPCKDAIGGIRDVVWIAHSDAKFGNAAAGQVTDTTATMDMFRWELSKNSGSFQQEVTSSVENGTVYFTQTLTIQTPKLSAADSAELRDVLKNRLSIIVRDNNDNFHIMGYMFGAEVTGGNFGTGTAKGDLNGYNLVFTAEEFQPAPFFINLADSTARGALTGAITIDPDYY
jgi:hypothetical protein